MSRGRGDYGLGGNYPSIGLLPLLAVPVLVVPLYFNPGITGLLALAGGSLALITAATSSTFPAVTNAAWLAALAAAGILVIDSRVRERARDARLEVESRLHESEARYRMTAETPLTSCSSSARRD
jgi:hypothetical protein